MITTYGTTISEFKAMVEVFCKLSGISAKYSEEQQFVELYKEAKKYRVQFLNGKFDHADVFKYNAECEGFVNQKSYTDFYEFIANI